MPPRESPIRHVIALLRGRNIWGYAGALGSRGVEVLCKFGLYMLIALKLGAHGAGLFFLCMTWVGLLAVAARMGLDRAVARHVATGLALGQPEAARAALRQCLGWTALGGLVATAATLLVAGPAARLLFGLEDLAAPLRVASAILLPICLVFALAGGLIGLNRGVMAQLLSNALPPALPLLALLLGVDGLEALLLLQALGFAICGVLGAVALGQAWRAGLAQPALAASDHPSPAVEGIWATARPLLVIDLLQVGLLSMPVLLLGVFASAVDVSRFSIAHRLTMLINTMLLSIAQVSAGAFARHHSRGEFAALRAVERQTRLLALLACLPVIGIMLAFPATLLGLMGDGFAVAAPALAVLTVAQLANVALPTQDMMLTMTGHGALLRRLGLWQFGLSLLLGLALVPAFGLMGAAVLSALGLVFGRISFALAVRRVLPQLSAPARRAAA
jgi:O-antigen/teichoic acid export membrane protein